MRVLTGAETIRIRKPRQVLTGATRIRLSQIRDLPAWHEQLVNDKHDNARVGEVRRWSDGKLHEKREHGWRVLPHSSEYDVLTNKKEEKRNRKTATPPKPATEKQFSDFIDSLNTDPHIREPKAIRLPQMNRKLMKQIGLDTNAALIFNSRYFHISPARKAAEGHGQDLRIEEYKEIPKVIKNARWAILEKDTGDFKLLFQDKKNPEKINKIVMSKTNKGNFIVTVGKVNKGNAYEPQKIKVVGEGVAPSI